MRVAEDLDRLGCLEGDRPENTISMSKIVPTKQQKPIFIFFLLLAWAVGSLKRRLGLHGMAFEYHQHTRKLGDALIAFSGSETFHRSR